MRTADHVLTMRIQEGSAGYGIYVMLLELLRDSKERSLVFNPRNLAFAINEPDTAIVERVIKDYGLFELSDDGRISSPWLDAQLDAYDQAKAAAQEAGRRGAAKRYGRSAPANDVSNGVPIAPLCPPLSAPHGNIIDITKQTDVTQSKSKLLGLTWEDMSGEQLFSIARKSGNILDDITRMWAKGKQEELDRDRGRGKHNLEALIDVCDYFHLSTGVFSWLCRFTNLAEVGKPPIVKLIRIMRECQETKFKPKYPADYVMTRCLEP